MIRVLHMIGGLNIGGSQSMVMNLYRKIDRNKIQFDFIIDHQDELYYEKEIKELGGRIYYIPAFNGLNLLSLIKNWNSFFKEHPEYKILHSHIRSYASLYLPIAKRNGVITIIHSHSTSNSTGLKKYAKTILQFPLRYQANYFFACSQTSGEWLYGKKTTKKSNYYILKNSIDASKYRFNMSNRNKTRKELNVDETCELYGHIGRFHESKNYPFLLKLFNAIHLKNKNTKLVLLGDGELKKDIKKIIRSYNLNDCVILLGFKENIDLYLQAFDYFLFPSLWEGLPVSLVEAQASGLPCLVSNTITKEVDITPTIHFLPINKGISPWLTKLDEITSTRIDTYQLIIDSGFDITHNVKWISDFYKKCYEESRYL